MFWKGIDVVLTLVRHFPVCIYHDAILPFQCLSRSSRLPDRVGLSLSWRLVQLLFQVAAREGLSLAVWYTDYPVRELRVPS